MTDLTECKKVKTKRNEILNQLKIIKKILGIE